jgi:hypothetical protein
MPWFLHFLGFWGVQSLASVLVEPSDLFITLSSVQCTQFAAPMLNSFFKDEQEV